jgi:hypothetical protein
MGILVIYGEEDVKERDAYLLNINDGVYTPEEAAHILTVYYWLPWPKSWMIKWFKNKVEK